MPRKASTPRTAHPEEPQTVTSPAGDRPTPATRKRRRAAAASGAPGEVAAQDEAEPLYYVGIGASAGGLEALRPFVANLPAHANMTYILAQHMSPDHRSLMVELLARETRLKVQEASNNQPPQADTIYVAPPNTDITVVNGKLRISKPTNTIGPKPSVDRFFMSLADDQEDRSIGVILSGTGSDGAHGIKAIKAAGGISIAQEPKSAKYDSMPNAAIRAGGTDLVLPPHEIADQLRSIVMLPRAPLSDEVGETPPSTIRGIVRQIATHFGMDFSNYKDATITRQIMRRMAAMQIANLDAYGEYIGSHPYELAELASNFLICVTSFFRDPESFEALRKSLHELLRTKRPGDDIRIWIPGCATGEEVYTLAILLSEELGEERDKYRIQLFATDINGDAVQFARNGVYPEAALSAIDGKLIARYFTVQDGLYRIDKALRNMTLYARQDLVQDPPFVRLDMVSCRNLLIYFKPELQERVVKVFHYALRSNGILFLGKSESIGRLGTLFVEKDRKCKVYVKRPGTALAMTPFPHTRALSGNDIALPNLERIPPNNSALAHDRLFELYAPASLLITGAGEILEIFGECGPFLTIRNGKADFNAFALIKPPFRAELRAFVHRVSRTRESALSNPIRLEIGGQPKHFTLAMHYVGNADSDDPSLLLVCFEQVQDRVAVSADAPGGPEAADRIVELEQEIVLNRENLQTVIEELETANEELQSLNEEAQAANEELQASNEELETANEELQASNEELITLNDELGTRTHELSEANSDLSNILDSVYKAIVVVDASLVVTRFNKVALAFFDLQQGVRANLATVVTHSHIPDLLKRVGSVIKTSAHCQFGMTRDDGRYFEVRITPYLDESRRGANGAVITIIDETERKVAEEKLRLSATVFEHASEGTLVTDAQNRIIASNPAMSRMTGYTADELLGQRPKILKSGEQPPEYYKQMWEVLLSSGAWQGEIQNLSKNGELGIYWLSINVLRDDAGEIVRHIAVYRDITEAKRAQATIERQATIDSLTGLPNRHLIMDRLNQMLSNARRTSHMFGVMFMDLDHFKSINDALGHGAGDDLLRTTAQRIKSALRDSDTVGRMGGDEFIVLLNDLGDTQDIAPVADKILAAVRKPLTIGGQTLQTATSIGVTVYPMDGNTPEALLKNADSAMYEAKKNGRNTFCFFTHRMQDEANKRYWMDREMRIGMEQDRMHIHYQPIVRLSDMSLAGAEALMQWHHPAKGPIPPEQFIPVAEQNGMIVPMSQWLIETSLAQWADIDASGPGLFLSFNLSAAQFVARDHIERLIACLRESRLTRNHQVTIEVTESLKLSDNMDYVKILTRFKDEGCQIAIDDFGTGYSSLNYLKRIPADIIKIDKSFVRDITTDPTDAAMIRAILQMADAFGLTTVAEGVETPDQLNFLQSYGCGYVQGFLFDKPLAFDALHARLRQPTYRSPQAKRTRTKAKGKPAPG
ncbi:MAG: EAL domain-containing protein [Rhodocyclaceae bacterium]|nr:EAL domain-containing protein [Rhodocyclaceae bacterium]